MMRAAAWIAVTAAMVLILGLQLDPRGYPVRVLCLLLLTASMAQSWNIAGGLSHQISLGHAAFFGTGAYTSTILLIVWHVSPWIGMLAGMIVAAAMAWLLAWPTMRLSGPYFALATLAFAEVCRVIANTLPVTNGAQGISVPFVGNSWGLMQFRASGAYLPLMAGLFALTSIVFAVLSHGRIGYMLRAMKSGEAAAEMAGIDTRQIKLISAAISAGLAAACGTVFAQFTFFFDPETVFGAASVSIRMALIAIVGGMGTLFGPLLGALLIVPLEELLNAWLSDKAAGTAPLVFGLVLVAIVIGRPEGLASLPFLRRVARAGAQR